MPSPVSLITRATLGVLLFIAIRGWGHLLHNPNRTSQQPPAVDPGALGLAALLTLGGILSTLHLLHRPVYLLLLAIGLIAAAIECVRKIHRRQFDLKWITIVAAGAFIALPMFLDSLDGAAFNPHDDCFAYLVMPTRIAQLGTLQFDPFSQRATVSAAGGIAFLQAPFVDLWGIRAVRIVDQGAGLLLFIAALATLFRRIGVWTPAAIILLAGTIILVRHPIVNVAAYFLPLTLLVALCALLLDHENQSISGPIIAAVYLAGMAMLKNTLLPFAGLLCCMMLIRDFHRRKSLAPRNAAIMATVFPLALLGWYLPWLTSWHIHFLPLPFITGTDAITPGYIFWWISQRHCNWFYFLVFFVLSASTLAVTRNKADRFLVAGMATSLILGSAIMTFITGGVAITRYMQPLFLITCLFCASILLTRIRSRAIALLTTAAVCAGFVTFQPNVYEKGYLQYCTGLFNRSDNTPTSAQITSAQKLQSSMTPGAAALVCLDSPYLLDFKRNRIFVIDFPNSVSPEPGMPVGDDARFVQYLQSLSIRYIAYSYGDEASLSEFLVNWRLQQPEFTPWQRILNKQVPLFHRQLRSVAAHWPKVYDDGQIFVVDISQSVTVPGNSND